MQLKDHEFFLCDVSHAVANSMHYCLPSCGLARAVGVTAVVGRRLCVVSWAMLWCCGGVMLNEL